jgi:hypothetical protein
VKLVELGLAQDREGPLKVGRQQNFLELHEPSRFEPAVSGVGVSMISKRSVLSGWRVRLASSHNSLRRGKATRLVRYPRGAQRSTIHTSDHETCFIRLSCQLLHSAGESPLATMTLREEGGMLEGRLIVPALLLLLEERSMPRRGGICNAIPMPPEVGLSS